MPQPLRALPFFDVPTKAVGPGVHEQVYRNQILVWVSISPMDQIELPQPTRRLPAILDTGINDTFVISPIQLRMGAGLRWEQLPEGGVERFYGAVPVPTRRAVVWLHPNQYGWRDLFDPLRKPLRMEFTDGITIYGDGEQVGTPATKTLRAPRLPLFGLRALTEIGAQLHIDCAQRLVSLSVPD